MSAPEPGASGTVLYVEDNATNQELMRSVVRKRPGVRLVVAGTGSQAIEAALLERPALILLDRGLPDMTGGEVLRHLRTRAETEGIPVVVISGDTADPGADEAALGVIAHLTKPYDVRELLSCLDRVLEAGG
ncbi:MAG: response regulator [Actinomycetota bacterium]